MADPLDMPLPCTITIGHATFGKGVKLRLLVEAAERWQRAAYPPLSAEEKAANLARLQGNDGVGACSVQPISPPDANGSATKEKQHGN